MVLPKIPGTIIKTLDNVIREYIWNGKKAKIAYSILQNPKNQGGLNLVNFKNKEIALKATWPAILINEVEYAEMVYKIMKQSELKQDIWRCKLHTDDVKHLKIRNQFWNDVLECWCHYNYSSTTRIENQFLWYNSQIRIRGMPFFWTDVHRNGLRYIHQLFENKQFKTEQQVRQQFGLTSMRFNSLKVAIPKQWKEYFMTYEPISFFPLPPHNYDLSVTVYKGNFSKRVYSYITDDITLMHYKYIKWAHELQEDIATDIYQFANVFKNIYKVTNVTKFRSFQYRLLQRGLITNIQLEKWGIVPSRLCTFCKDEDESIIHLLCQCQQVKTLWEQVEAFLRDEYAVYDFEMNLKNIIINSVSNKMVANFLCLLTKQFIYRQRCLGEQISFPILKRYIKMIENIEKYLAVKAGRVNHHNKKWNTHHIAE